MKVYPCSGKLSYLHKKLVGKHLSFNYCCEEHDFAYDEGGTIEDRKLADIRFRDCILSYKQVGFKKYWLFVVGWIIYYTVRVFGCFRFNYIESTK